jgi:class 3 adenylate cyclase/methyl-accepting chemotaxis protein
MPKTGEPVKGLFLRLGVRGRLLLAFLGISAFAALGATAGMVSFLAIGDGLDGITQQRAPSALASLELSRQAERIVAAAPALLAAQTPDQHAQQSQAISVEVERLDALLSDLRGSMIDATGFEELDVATTRLRINLKGLDALVAGNLALGEQKKNLIQAVISANSAIQRLLTPWVQVTESKISQLRGSSEDAALSQDERSAALAELVRANDFRESLQQTRLEASIINDALLQVGAVEQSDRLTVAEFRLRRRIGTLEKLSSGFDEKLRTLMSAQIEAFRGLNEGSGGLPALRKKELERAQAGQGLLQENAELVRQLTAAVDSLVGAAKGDIETANLDARSVQRLGSGVLIGAVVLSLVSSTLIVWLYVGRNLVARLTALSHSMLAIANGNLKTQLPPGGTDEVGRMAEALAVFRDTAVEVEATNLREIEEARRRLTDAIESISEGFSLFDAEDRLVICNSRYHEQLYPGMSNVVQPGTSFETIIRTAVERGLVDEVNDFESVEAWVEDRLERHRNPSGSFVQRRGKQQWIQISERRTEDGGHVAVYTDITEIKDREEELAEKSKALEQLSSQLAKYLSPQVYNSIFSGKQEVKVASSRKKLTVFFSDIAGFTETADRLESEELTQLLNQYLTEMSQIALDHGATIDKYVGDAIVIFFGDPETQGVKEDALACVRMAIAMRRRLQELERIWRQSGIEKPLKCRMGIHTGFCTVGNFGSEDRMDYTIIGSAVNTASRLETLAAAGEILISYETFAHVRDLVHCEEYGQAEVKGIAYPIVTYRVVDTLEVLDRQQRHFRAEHPAVRVELDLDAMTAADRVQALETLRQAQTLLSDCDSSGKTGVSGKHEPKQKKPGES